MKTKRKRLAWTVLPICMVAGTALPPVHGQDANGHLPAEPTMLQRSPFLPPGFNPPQSGRSTPQARQSAAGYEFRGVYQLGEEYRFLVSEPRSRSGSWVQVGKSYDGYEVRGYDPETETLTLFFNNSLERLQLAEVDANPTPMPVSGQIQRAGSNNPNEQAAPTPIRRTIRPASRTTEPGAEGSRTTPPPPAWLEKLREEAAARRNQAAQRAGVGGGGASLPPGVNPSGAPGQSIPEPPSGPPPEPPPNLSEIDIPPPPTELPPPPPPEIMEKIQQSMSTFTPPGS